MKYNKKKQRRKKGMKEGGREGTGREERKGGRKDKSVNIIRNY